MISGLYEFGLVKCGGGSLVIGALILRLLKVTLVVLAIPVAVVASLFAWTLFKFEVLYPLQYARLQNEAAEWNRENWETGSAVRVTVQVSSDVSLGRESATATVDCYQKQVATPGGPNGRQRAPKVIQREGPAFLVVSFGPTATYHTSLRDICGHALREHDDWQLPQVTNRPYGYESYIVANDRSFSCFLGSEPRTSTREVTRPTFVDAKEVPPAHAPGGR